MHLQTPVEIPLDVVARSHVAYTGDMGTEMGIADFEVRGGVHTLLPFWCDRGPNHADVEELQQTQNRPACADCDGDVDSDPGLADGGEGGDPNRGTQVSQQTSKGHGNWIVRRIDSSANVGQILGPRLFWEFQAAQCNPSAVLHRLDI